MPRKQQQDPPRPTTIPFAERAELIAAAIREGRHEADIRDWKGVVCHGCREWRKDIYELRGGKPLCRKCVKGA